MLKEMFLEAFVGCFKIFIALEIVKFYFLEVVEHACGVTSLQMGETVEDIATDMDIKTIRQPLGVTAGICP